ncbi:MAG: plasmid mobilization relaxosome protein MobC [Candidatus Omnitrophota bacterium]
MAGGSGTAKGKRTYILPVRFDEAEQQALAELVEATGYTRAALIRHGLFRTSPPRAVSRPTVEHQEVARLLGALGRIGGNINQLAKHANAGRYQSNSIELALRELRELRTACLKALGQEP